MFFEKEQTLETLEENRSKGYGAVSAGKTNQLSHVANLTMNIITHI